MPVPNRRMGEAAQGYILADNQLALNAGWDTELLALPELADRKRSTKSST